MELESKQMEKCRKIPYGISSYGTIRREGYYYVDKTRFIPKLEDAGRFLFLIRPRRFGKSLLISTLHEIFSGNKALFNGLSY